MKPGSMAMNPIIELDNLVGKGMRVSKNIFNSDDDSITKLFCGNLLKSQGR
jgi:hypothetical protein